MVRLPPYGVVTNHILLLSVHSSIDRFYFSLRDLPPLSASHLTSGSLGFKAPSAPSTVDLQLDTVLAPIARMHRPPLLRRLGKLPSLYQPLRTSDDEVLGGSQTT